MGGVARSLRIYALVYTSCRLTTAMETSNEAVPGRNIQRKADATPPTRLPHVMFQTSLLTVRMRNVAGKPGNEARLHLWTVEPIQVNSIVCQVHKSTHIL